MQRHLIVILFAMMAACSQPPAPVQETTSESRPQAATGLTQQCTNTRFGFTISYPDGWHTNDGSVIAACSVFDPEPIQLPPQSEIPFEISVLLHVEDTPFNPTVTSSQWERVIGTETLKIAGRDAVRVEAEATGEGLADRGMRSLRYVVDAGNGRTFTATTHDTGAAYAQEKEILAQMVESLSFQ